MTMILTEIEWVQTLRRALNGTPLWFTPSTSGAESMLAIVQTSRFSSSGSLVGILGSPMFIDRVTDFAQLRDFTRQLHDLQGRKMLHGIGGRIAQRLEQPGMHQHRDVMLGQSEQYGGLRHVQHRRQPAQIQQLPRLVGNQRGLFTDPRSQDFIDRAIHACSRLKVIVTEAMWVFSAAA
jgi:hypothetical protein